MKPPWRRLRAGMVRRTRTVSAVGRKSMSRSMRRGSGEGAGEGRGIHHKTLVAAAVEVRHRKPSTEQDKRKDGRYAGRVRLAIAADRSANSLCGFVENAVMPGSLIVTDDWSGYASLRKRGYDHHAIAESGDPEIAEQFMPMIHLVFANLKSSTAPPRRKREASQATSMNSANRVEGGRGGGKGGERGRRR